jgi:hypothetical protein
MTFGAIFHREALQIILSMPKRLEEIFPYSGETIGTNFTRACQFLEIIDLHLHDLRHDGVSRLFEIGRNIPQVAAVSGHRSWSSLKRYTHLRQTGDKYACPCRKPCPAWQSIENRTMIVCNEGSLQAHWLDGCGSDPVAGNA